jgi:alpha-mannosidase
MTRFARARQVAGALVESALDAVADSVPPPSDRTIRAVVVNPDAVERIQVVAGFIDLAIDSAEPWRHVDAQALDRPIAFWPVGSTVVNVADAHGNAVPFQVLGEERVVHHEMSRYETPWAVNVRRVHLAWWAQTLPPCGYAIFDLTVGESRAATPAAPRCENEHLAVSVNDDGTFDIRDKHTGTIYRNAAALEDVGDVGDEYTYCPPASDRRVTNGDARVIRTAIAASGPLRTTLRVELELPVPASARADRSGRAAEIVDLPVAIEATIDAGSPRVAFRVTVDNRARDHRVRIVFPTAAARVDSARADSAFDVVARPSRQPVPPSIDNEAPVSSAPMISLVDAGDGSAGATVIGKGLMEYEIVGDEPAIAITLIRAVGDLSRNDLPTRPSGQAGPPVATPGAQCLGRHTFELAFEPHAAPRTNAALIASARAHNLQPRVAVARGTSGRAPLERAFLRIDRRSGDVVLSALKQAEDRPTTIVRLFNPDDAAAEAVLSFDWPIAKAFAVNFLEERQHELAVSAGGVAVRLQPRQIQTIEVVAE